MTLERQLAKCGFSIGEWLLLKQYYDYPLPPEQAVARAEDDTKSIFGTNRSLDFRKIYNDILSCGLLIKTSPAERLQRLAFYQNSEFISFLQESFFELDLSEAAFQRLKECKRIFRQRVKNVRVVFIEQPMREELYAPTFQECAQELQRFASTVSGPPIYPIDREWRFSTEGPFVCGAWWLSRFERFASGFKATINYF
jgi:CRISPR/Cas system-associated endoribonuclease Cas2